MVSIPIELPYGNKNDNNKGSLWSAPYVPSSVCVCVCVCVWGFPGGSDGRESARNAGDLGSVPRQGKSPGEKNGYIF